MRHHSIALVTCVDDLVPFDSIGILTSALSYVFRVSGSYVVFEKDAGPNICNNTNGEVHFIATHRVRKRPKVEEVADLAQSDFFCVFDPDILFDIKGLQTFVQILPELENVGLVYGIVGNKCDGSFVSKLLSVDKNWSHRVVRPSLARLGISITVPGQFYIVRRDILLDNPVPGSYLDDLELGLHIRIHSRQKMIRLPILVGRELSRSCWTALMSQRIRWMKGLIHLMHWCIKEKRPRAIVLCMLHLGAYHLIPVCIISSAVFISALGHYHIAFLIIMVWLVSLIAVTIGHPFVAALYGFIFPLVHIAAVLISPVQFSETILRRRE